MSAQALGLQLGSELYKLALELNKMGLVELEVLAMHRQKMSNVKHARRVRHGMHERNVQQIHRQPTSLFLQ